MNERESQREAERERDESKTHRDESESGSSTFRRPKSSAVASAPQSAFFFDAFHQLRITGSDPLAESRISSSRVAKCVTALMEMFDGRPM